MGWNEIGYVISSSYRTKVLELLADGPKTPSTLAEETGIPIAHISRALTNLREKDLAELLVEEKQQKGRIYAATDKGEEVWQQIESDNLAEA